MGMSPIDRIHTQLTTSIQKVQQNLNQAMTAAADKASKIAKFILNKLTGATSKLPNIINVSNFQRTKQENSGLDIQSLVKSFKAPDAKTGGYDSPTGFDILGTEINKDNFAQIKKELMDSLEQMRDTAESLVNQKNDSAKLYQPEDPDLALVDKTAFLAIQLRNKISELPDFKEEFQTSYNNFVNDNEDLFKEVNGEVLGKYFQTSLEQRDRIYDNLYEALTGQVSQTPKSSVKEEAPVEAKAETPSEPSISGESIQTDTNWVESDDFDKLFDKILNKETSSPEDISTPSSQITDEEFAAFDRLAEDLKNSIDEPPQDSPSNVDQETLDFLDTLANQGPEETSSTTQKETEPIKNKGDEPIDLDAAIKQLEDLENI